MVVDFKLSQEAVHAYEACLESENKNLFVQPSSIAMSSEDFLVTVKLRPWVKPGPEYPVKLANFINGNLVGGDNLKIQEGGKVVVHVRRDLDKDFAMTVTVGNETEEVDLPPRPTQIRVETRYAQAPLEVTTGVDVDQDVNASSCLDIENDDPAVIIPGTVKWVLKSYRHKG